MGLLVHHAEAHVLQNRHALRQRDRTAEAPHLEADAAIDGLGAPVEVRAQRPRRRQARDHLDVVDGDERRIAGAIAFRERVAVALRTARARVPGSCTTASASDEPVGPGADDVADGLFQHRAFRLRRFAVVAADDEVHAHQRPFREERIVGAHAALVDLGEILRRSRRAPRCCSGRAARTRTPRRSGRSGRGATAPARAGARRAAGSASRTGRACPRRSGTARRARRYRARWPAPCRNGRRDRSRRA